MKQCKNPEVDEAVYSWFVQQRHRHVPVSSVLLNAKALEIHQQFFGNNDGSVASSGWLDKFKTRHGIRFLKVCSEKLPSDVNAVHPFKAKVLQNITDMNMTPDQVYNADESACFWKVLPDKTFITADEKAAPGRKISEDRFTCICRAQMLQVRT